MQFILVLLFSSKAYLKASSHTGRELIKEPAHNFHYDSHAVYV